MSYVTHNPYAFKNQHGTPAFAALTFRRSISIAFLFACMIVVAHLSVAQQRRLAPVTIQENQNVIPGEYIVVFKSRTSRKVVQAAQNTVTRLGGTIGFTYTSALIGFSAKLPPNALEAVRAISGVSFIEPNQKYSFDIIQPNPPAGLDRIDRRLQPLDNQYTYPPTETGTGVHVYVIDSGIWIAHSEFGGRASSDFSVTPSLDDCLGHGTHVAGTIGGTTFGIAKNVRLHSVRVGDSMCVPTAAATIAGVNWVTANRNPAVPNVANMSLGGGFSAAVDMAVANSIAAGITYVVAAGNFNTDACGFSPASRPDAITVGSTVPNNDTRAGSSNFGACLDLFAPGVGIVSAMPDGLPPICTVVSTTPGSQTQSCSGTSMASPHVAGVAARYLENHPFATPAAVWAAIHHSADVSTTPGWPGVLSLGAGSPNELLHWGSLNDGFDDGDPHMTTVDGTHYDFQGAGEYVALRDGNGLEIQTRQTPVPTASIVTNPFTGLGTCVSLNTAVAARVGTHRVTFEPNLSGVPDPSGLQLRIDGVLTTLTSTGVNLGGGGRVMSSTGGGIQIDFPDGTVLTVIPGFWNSQGKWYLFVGIHGTPAQEGLMGSLVPGSWLPALPDGSSMGPMPATLHQRYLDLYQKFGDAWRVSNKTSLFDYAAGTSTATFTIASWPNENLPCTVPEAPVVKPVDRNTAEKVCRAITDEKMKSNCIFDVAVTGEPGFAKTYEVTQRIRRELTTTSIINDKNSTRIGEPVTFIAAVDGKASADKRAPAGIVQFTLDGERVGKPVKLDANGQATWKTSTLRPGKHQVAASYMPGKGSMYLASTSVGKLHSVTDAKQ